MNEGRVEQVDAPARVFHSPETKYAAEFLGTVDFLPVSVDDGQLSSELGQMDARDIPLTAFEGRSLLLEIMVRPDCLECYADDDGSAYVEEREFRGAFYLYRLRLASGRQVRCLMSHTIELPVGAAVSVRLREGHQTRLFVDGRLAQPSGFCN